MSEPFYTVCRNMLDAFEYNGDRLVGKVYEAKEEMARVVQEYELAKNPYGRCPHCGSEVIRRERRPNGDDHCKNGHIYPSKASIKPAAAGNNATHNKSSASEAGQ